MDSCPSLLIDREGPTWAHPIHRSESANRFSKNSTKPVDKGDEVSLIGGTYLEETKRLHVVSFVEGESVVDSSGQNEEISRRHCYSNKLRVG